MSEVYKEVKPVKVYYKCDNCNEGIVDQVDCETVKCDDGEYHIICTYKCPVCGIVDQLYDKSYPYIDYIDIGDFKPR